MEDTMDSTSKHMMKMPKHMMDMKSMTPQKMRASRLKAMILSKKASKKK